VHKPKVTADFGASWLWFPKMGFLTPKSSCSQSLLNRRSL